jgi:phosphotransferase system enzyme I (PtsP)
MGGRQLEALALMGLGFRRFSITPVSVGPIKELVRQVDLKEITEAMNRWLSSPPQDIRASLSKWAAKHAIDID